MKQILLTKLYDFDKKTDFSFLKGLSDVKPNLNIPQEQILWHGIFNLVMIFFIVSLVAIFLIIKTKHYKKKFTLKPLLNINTVLLTLILLILLSFIVIPTINQYYQCINEVTSSIHFINEPVSTIQICGKLMKK